jgi:hypothetical protein
MLDDRFRIEQQKSAVTATTAARVQGFCDPKPTSDHRLGLVDLAISLPWGATIRLRRPDGHQPIQIQQRRRAPLQPATS